MWWPRLFRGSAQIAWDDYEKDYSDLPAEVLAPHSALEAARDAVRRLEASEAAQREALEVRPDARGCRICAELQGLWGQWMCPG